MGVFLIERGFAILKPLIRPIFTGTVADLSRTDLPTLTFKALFAVCFFCAMLFSGIAGGEMRGRAVGVGFSTAMVFQYWFSTVGFGARTGRDFKEGTRVGFERVKIGVCWTLISATFSGSVWETSSSPSESVNAVTVQGSSSGSIYSLLISGLSPSANSITVAVSENIVSQEKRKRAYRNQVESDFEEAAGRLDSRRRLFGR